MSASTRPLAPVVSLLSRCRPSAVRRLVMTVVVDSIDAVHALLCAGVSWTRSHISQKSREVFAPRLTHANAASAVAVIARICLIFTSGYCLTPCAVLGCVGGPMRRHSNARRGVFVTAAGFNTAVQQVSCVKRRLISAVAQTFSFCVTAVTKGNNNQARKSIANSNVCSRPSHYSNYISAGCA
jgi:hypothetical protein